MTPSALLRENILSRGGRGTADRPWPGPAPRPLPSYARRSPQHASVGGRRSCGIWSCLYSTGRRFRRHRSMVDPLPVAASAASRISTSRMTSPQPGLCGGRRAATISRGMSLVEVCMVLPPLGLQAGGLGHHRGQPKSLPATADGLGGSRSRPVSGHPRSFLPSPAFWAARSESAPITLPSALSTFTSTVRPALATSTS